MEKDNENIRRIMLAINKIDGVYYLLARHYGINENTLAFFGALYDGKPHSQKQISDEWVIPRTTINSIVKDMRSKGYIEFSAQEHSKEKALLLTPAGRRYTGAWMDEIYAAEERAILDTLQKFSPEFVDALEHFSSCLQAGLDEIIGKTEKTES